MEAESVEDGGKGIKFNVYVYNIQPDIIIDYKTGDNRAEDDDEKEAAGHPAPGKSVCRERVYFKYEYT